MHLTVRSGCTATKVQVRVATTTRTVWPTGLMNHKRLRMYSLNIVFLVSKNLQVSCRVASQMRRITRHRLMLWFCLSRSHRLDYAVVGSTFGISECGVFVSVWVGCISGRGSVLAGKEQPNVICILVYLINYIQVHGIVCLINCIGNCENINLTRQNSKNVLWNATRETTHNMFFVRFVCHQSIINTPKLSFNYAFSDCQILLGTRATARIVFVVANYIGNCNVINAHHASPYSVYQKI